MLFLLQKKKKDQILPMFVFFKCSWSRKVIDVIVIITGNNFKKVAALEKAVYNKNWPYIWKCKKNYKTKSTQRCRKCTYRWEETQFWQGALINVYKFQLVLKMWEETDLG